MIRIKLFSPLRMLLFLALIGSFITTARAMDALPDQQPSGFWFVREVEETEQVSLLPGVLDNGLLEVQHGDQVYRLNMADQLLQVLSTIGGPDLSYALPSMPVSSIDGMAVGPSIDPTDDPAQVSVFVSGSGRVYELVYQSPPQVIPAYTIIAVLENTVDMSSLNPPSPDPAGITFVPNSNTLVVSDSEVNETPLYDDVNVFKLSPAGNLIGTNDTTDFTDEPTGVAYRPTGNGQFFFSDDDQDNIYVVVEVEDDLGGGDDCDDQSGDDGCYEVLTVLSTDDFGSNDPEGLAYDTRQGHLFVVDGSGREVYDLDPGPDGQFGNGNDTVSNFDVASLGATDPEGIAFDHANNLLLVMDSTGDRILVVSRDGVLLNLIDISAAGAIKPAGITLAPASDNSGITNLYIVDRGVDNDSNPQENDGKLYEMRMPEPVITPTNTPVPTNTPTNTPLPTNTPTNTPVPTNTPTNTPLPTNTPTNTPLPTNTPTNTPVSTIPATNTPVSTNTPIPSRTSTPNASVTPTSILPTATPPPVATETPTPVFTPTATPEVTPTSVPPPNTRIQFLPLVFNRQNTWGEPNDSCGEAFSTAINVSRRFFAEDRDDWYRFTLSAPAEVTVHLTEFAPLAGQIAAYRGDTCGTSTFLDNNGTTSFNKTLNLGAQPAGTYFIYVSNDGPLNNTNLYTLLFTSE